LQHRPRRCKLSFQQPCCREVLIAPLRGPHKSPGIVRGFFCFALKAEPSRTVVPAEAGTHIAESTIVALGRISSQNLRLWLWVPASAGTTLDCGQDKNPGA